MPKDFRVFFWLFSRIGYISFCQAMDLLAFCRIAGFDIVKVYSNRPFCNLRLLN
jgi:hypothetical protein